MSMNKRINDYDFTADYFHNHCKTYESKQSDARIVSVPGALVVLATANNTPSLFFVVALIMTTYSWLILCLYFKYMAWIP